jgi:hypothetical protein
MIWNILTTLLGIGGAALEKRQKLKEIELEGRTQIAVAQAQAEIARLNKSVDAEINWDTEVGRQMEHSWKDEFLTLILTAPVVLAFCGDDARKAAAEGFAAIALAPDWYKASFMAAIAASFGIRALVNKFGGLGK